MPIFTSFIVYLMCVHTCTHYNATSSGYPWPRPCAPLGEDRQLHYGGYDRGRIISINLDAMVGPLVCLAAILVELFEFRGVTGERPVRSPVHAGAHFGKRAIEPDDDAIFLEQRAVHLLCEGPAAQGHHHGLSTHHLTHPFLDGASLDFSEFCFSVAIEDFRDGSAVLG